jgi:hypothetical protein
MAFGASTFNAAGGAVDDLFSAKASGMKAKGYALEAASYYGAAAMADKNAAFAKTSSDIQQVQLERKGYMSLGATEADVAGGGFAMSGSAIDLLRDSASQDALSQAVAGYQGLINEEGYQQQADSYRNMAAAAQIAEKSTKDSQTGKYISGGIKAATSIATLFT